MNKRTENVKILCPFCCVYDAIYSLALVRYDINPFTPRRAYRKAKPYIAAAGNIANPLRIYIAAVCLCGRTANIKAPSENRLLRGGSYWWWF